MEEDQVQQTDKSLDDKVEQFLERQKAKAEKAAEEPKPSLPPIEGMKKPRLVKPAQSPRAWVVQRHGRSSVMEPRSVLVTVADYLKTGEGLSRQERARLGRILDSMIDRVCELQRAYDLTVTRNEEFDPEANPHRMNDGTGMFIRFNVNTDEELNWCFARFLSTPVPFPASLVVRNAGPEAMVTEVLYPRMDFSNGVAGGLFTCILRIGRKAEDLKPAEGPVDSAQSPVNDGDDVVPSEDKVRVLPVDKGPDTQDENLSQVSS